MDAAAREFVQAEMRRPFDVDGLPEVPNPKTAVEVNAASLLAIEVDTPAERDYLRRLAQDFLPFVNPDLSHFLPHLHYRLTTHPACLIARTMT